MVRTRSQHFSSLLPEQRALDESSLRHLAPELHRRVLVLVEQDSVFVAALTCNLFHTHTRALLGAGFAISIKSVVSTLDRLVWVRSLGQDGPQWLWRWDASTCAAIALSGNLEALEWARSNGCEWDKDTCSCAAGGGHLRVLQWARQNGCDWDWCTCSSAAQGGHLEVLQWARQNGCEWNDY